MILGVLYNERCLGLNDTLAYLAKVDNSDKRDNNGPEKATSQGFPGPSR